MKTTMTTGFQELGRKILEVVNASHATTPEVDTSCGNATYPLFNGDCDVIIGTKPPTRTSQVYHNVPSYDTSSNMYRETEPSYNEQLHPEQPMISSCSRSSITNGQFSSWEPSYSEQPYPEQPMTSSFSRSLVTNKRFEPSYCNSLQPRSEQPVSTLKSSRMTTASIDYNGLRHCKQPYQNEQCQPQEFDDTNNNSIWSEASGSDIFEIDEPMNDGEATCSQVSFSELLNPVYLTQVRSNSSSRANFAANLMRAMFTKETRISSNVAGKCGKRKLDPSKIASIKVATFNMWPCTPGETPDVCWKACVKAIDEANRRLVRRK